MDIDTNIVHNTDTHIDNLCSLLPPDFDFSSIAKVKGSIWDVLLYPDDDYYRSYVQSIKDNFPDEYAMILHHSDTWTTADEIDEPEHKAGTLKKAHTHVALCFQEQRHLSAIAKKIGIKPNYIRRRPSRSKELRYLVHVDHPSKYQYPIDEVEGPLKQILECLLTGTSKQSADIFQMVLDGKSNFDIIKIYPSAYTKLAQIDQLRQMVVREKYKNQWRDLEVTYIWGESGTGKTRSVMEKYGYENVYRVSSYDHPFDQYKGQDVILFDEFRSSLGLADMLSYLDGYPLELPCRYTNRQACYTKVYIISNIPLSRQYGWMIEREYESVKAFYRRIHHVYFMVEDWKLVEDDDCPFIRR